MAQTSTAKNYYLENKGRLIRDFQETGQGVRAYLLKEMPVNKADDLIALSNVEFERILGRLPDIGGDGNRNSVPSPI